MYKAILRNYRQSPRKVRLVADMIRGARVDRALRELDHASQRAAKPLGKLVRSAVANAQNTDKNLAPDQLVVGTITVDEGFTLHRFIPRAFGRATPLHKRTSHITVVLSEQRNDQIPSNKDTNKTKASEAKEAVS